MSASLPFDREPLTGGERLPVADKLRTDRGEAETPYPPAFFFVFKVKFASGGLRNFL